MKIKFVNSDIANNFFIISNLAEWHFSCRREYNRKWLDLTGKLNSEERQAIKVFKGLMKKYGFDRRDPKAGYLGGIFLSGFSPVKVWRELKIKLPISDYRKTRFVFDVFSKRYKQIKNLISQSERRKRILILSSAINKSKNKKIIKELDCIFGERSSEKEIKVVIIFSPLDSKETAAGGANVDGDVVTFEVPELEKDSLNLDISIGILFHEIIHIFFNELDIRKAIAEKIKKLGLPQKPGGDVPFSTAITVNEILINCFAPFGFLTKKYYGPKFYKEIFSPVNLSLLKEAYLKFRRGENFNIYRLIKYFAWRLSPLVERYVKLYGPGNEKIIKIIVEKLK